MIQTSNSQKMMKGISSQTIATLTLGVVEMVFFSIMSRLLTKEDFGYRWGIVGVAASVVVASTITKLIKIFYIFSKVNVSVLKYGGIILSSWLFALYLVHVSAISLFFLPNYISEISFNL